MSDFPELRRVFSAYLHEDVFAGNGTPESALREYRDDASPAELRRFRKEIARFIARTAALDLDELRQLLQQLGCRWLPPSYEALVALLTGAAGPIGPG